MNYKRIYEEIIERGKLRFCDGVIVESHHIIPRSLGGSDEPENLVNLTLREHFVAHLCLARIYGGVMTRAAFMMSGFKKYNSKKYEKLKESARLLMINRIVSQETISKIMTPERNMKISVALTGRKHTDIHRQRNSAARIGKKLPKEHVDAMSAGMLGDKNPMYGRTHTEEARKAISEANKIKIQCPYCDVTGGQAIMKRWHFDKCKLFNKGN